MLLRGTGVDPGLVDTGVVTMTFDTSAHSIVVTHYVLIGLDVRGARAACNYGVLPNHIWIEGYKPRGHLAPDKRMVEGVRLFKDALPGSQVLDNMGVKKVVTKSLMELLGVWNFGTPTHHQDLRSAARILLFGMLKDEYLNTVIADIVRDHLNGKDWVVT